MLVVHVEEGQIVLTYNFFRPYHPSAVTLVFLVDRRLFLASTSEVVSLLEEMFGPLEESLL
jgi:hypothetical protein